MSDRLKGGPAPVDPFHNGGKDIDLQTAAAQGLVTIIRGVPEHIALAGQNVDAVNSIADSLEIIALYFEKKGLAEGILTDADLEEMRDEEEGEKDALPGK